MKRIFEFVCVKGHVTEKYIDESERVVQCPHCGNDASRIISPVRTALDPISGDFPGATMAWERKREEKIKLERKSGLSEYWSGK
jgi:hypothetical protein